MIHPTLLLSKVGQFNEAWTSRYDDDFIKHFPPMNTYSQLFGIDVRKDTLDIACLADQATCVRQIANTNEAILNWLENIDPHTSLCVLEPTGSYSARLVYHLQEKGIAVSLVNPNQSAGFAQAQGIISKNDRQAARTLALMGRTLDLPLYPKQDAMRQQRKQLLNALTALKKQRQMLKNQLHALQQYPLIQPTAQQAYEQTLETIEQQIDQLKEQLEELSDEEHQRMLKRMETVVGIGQTSAQALLLAIGSFTYFQHARQVSKFLGLVPSSHFSGTSVFIRGRISKKGCSEVRANLYMAARSAIRFNLACKDLYERLRAKGKPHKQAMVAVMNKLVKQIFGCVVNNTDFDNQFYLRFKSD